MTAIQPTAAAWAPAPARGEGGATTPRAERPVARTHEVGSTAADRSAEHKLFRVEVRSTSTRSIIRVGDEALSEGDLPFLAPQPAFRLVEQPFRLTVFACGACDRDARALPDVVVVYLGD